MYFIPEELAGYRWLLAPTLIFTRYFLLALICYLAFYVWRRRAWFYLKIQQKFPKDADLRREMLYSAITALIFGETAYLILGTPLRQYTRIYTEIHTYGVLYLLLSVPLTLIIHDTYFYWMHRLMHHPRLFKHLHRVHHQSVNPSPWAAYAFHPLEALVEVGILPILLFFIPLHPLAFFTFVTLMLWFNVYGHLGYELFPAAVYRHPLGRYLNSGIYHNLHHERFHGNYGLYFTVWDRLMGTLRADNEQQIAQVHQRIASRMPEKSSQHIVTE